jgi:natural product precursor
MKLKKIKLINIVNEKLTIGELELLKGGAYQSTCGSIVCSAKIDDHKSYCTNGDPVCTSKMS